jgi:hypothetical protein
MGTGSGNPGSANTTGGLLGGAGTTGTGITGTGGSTTGSGGAGANTCGDVTTNSAKLPPDILLVQDRSGSMANNDQDMSCQGGCGTMSKWSELTTVLQQVLTSTDSGVNWGLKFLASPGQNQCGISAGADVPIAQMNAANVIAALQANGPQSATPTRAAITAATAYMQTLTDTNPKYLLLATDGLPNCPANCSGNACTNTPNTTEDGLVTQAIMAAQTAGFKTFVVGIGQVQAAVTALNDFANAGGVPQTGAATSYYAATDATALQNAFTTIVGAAGSCTFSVPMPPPTSSRSAIGVTADGNNVPKDTNNANGWNYTDASMTSIQIYGPTCDAIKAGTIQNVTIVFHCIIG